MLVLLNSFLNLLQVAGCFALNIKVLLSITACDETLSVRNKRIICYLCGCPFLFLLLFKGSVKNIPFKEAVMCVTVPFACPLPLEAYHSFILWHLQH